MKVTLQIKEVNHYITSDGTEFDSERAAEEHELSLMLDNALQEYLVYGDFRGITGAEDLIEIVQEHSELFQLIIDSGKNDEKD